MTYHVAQLVIKNWNRNIVNLGVLVGQVMAYKLNCHRCKKIDDDIENYRLQMPSENFFQWNSELSGMGRKYWVDEFWGIWGIFGLNYHHQFWYSESLVHISIIQPLFLQNAKPWYPLSMAVPVVEFSRKRYKTRMFFG